MKTMKHLQSILFILSCSLLFSGCMKEDIDELRAQQADNAARIAALEAWQKTVNTNITALQGLVSALETKDFVTGVTPKVEGGVEVGYTITFTKSGPVVIYHGKKGDTGASGLTPVIGVKQDTDGKYYWTVQVGSAAADWLRDGSGNKIPTTGADGKDAVSPQVRINTTTNEWEISTDGGVNWTSTGVKATGATGAQGATGPQGDAIFAANGVDNTNADYVEFTLADGTTKICVPKYISLGITFTQPAAFVEGEIKTVSYTLQGATPAVMTAINVPAGWKVSFDKTNKQIKVTAPGEFTADNAGANAVILLSDGGERTVMRTLMLSAGIGAYYYIAGVKAGVVFRPKTDDANGLVVSLDESAFLQWSTENVFTGATADWDGLANMKVIAERNAWNAYPAFKWAHEKNPAGTTYTSGDKGKWYLPAVYELSWILYPVYNTDRAAFNGKLTGASGTVLSDSWYWSSTESVTNRAWNVHFSDGITLIHSKDYHRWIRAVLAF